MSLFGRSREFAAFSGDFSWFLAGFREFCSHTEDAMDMSGRPWESAESRQVTGTVQVYAASHEEFAKLWAHAVTSAADTVTAEIAGAWMAGATHGDLCWQADGVPVPRMLGASLVREAFCLSVYEEVWRRLTASTGPGAFG